MLKKKNVCGIIIISLIITITLVIYFIHNKPIYSISSRIDDVKDKKNIKDSKFKTIGWLRIQGTDIDYPIIYSPDENEAFPVELESYVWSNNKDDKFHENILIEGHNIFNLSSKPKKHSKLFKRFEELMAFMYYDFAKENQYIQLTIDGNDYLYKIFAVSFIDVSTSTFLPKLGKINDEEFVELKKITKENSLYDYDVDIKRDDKFISLSTCIRFYLNETEREYYVHGRLLRNDEKPIKYKVKKSKKYKEIEKLWEDDENEENA